MPFPQILLTIVSLVFYFVARDQGGWLFRQATLEDHLFENLQFLSLLLLAVVAWGLASVLRKPKVIPWLAKLGALFFLFVAMEEISWGQRIFNFSWSSLQNLNQQGEVNLHNLLPLRGHLIPYFVATLLLAILPWILRALAKHNGLKISRWQVWDALISAMIMAWFYYDLEMIWHMYFYEYSELWLYSCLLLQLTPLWASANQKSKGIFGLLRK